MTQLINGTVVGAKPITINDSFNFVQKLTPVGLNSRNTNDGFGEIFDKKDDLVVVGVPSYSFSNDGTTTRNQTGCVWVFRRNDKGFWDQEAKLSLPNEDLNANMGSSIKIYNGKIFVGVPGYSLDKNGENESDNAGAVFVYSFDSSWVLETVITAQGVNGRNANDKFGTSVCFRGENLYVGSPGHQYDLTGANAITQAGAVFKYQFITTESSGIPQIPVVTPVQEGENNGSGIPQIPVVTPVQEGETSSTSSWTLISKIIAMGVSPRSSGDLFGTRIFSTDEQIFIQSPGYKFDNQGGNPLTNAGALFIYDSSDSYQNKIVGQNRIQNNNFGKKVSFGSNILTISEINNSSLEQYILQDGDWVYKEFSNFITSNIPDVHVSYVLTSNIDSSSPNISSFTRQASMEFYLEIGASRNFTFPSSVLSNSNGNMSPSQNIGGQSSTTTQLINELRLFFNRSYLSLDNPYVCRLGFKNGTEILSGRRYHVLITWNCGIQNLYVDGQYVESNVYNQNFNLTNTPIRIFNTSSNDCQIKIYDYRIYVENLIHKGKGSFVPPQPTRTSSLTSQVSSCEIINDKPIYSNISLNNIDIFGNHSTGISGSGVVIFDGLNCLRPFGDLNYRTPGIFGFTITTKDQRISISSPQDNLNDFYQDPINFTGSVYETIVEDKHNTTKYVSGYRSTQSLYFGDILVYNDANNLEIHSPDMQVSTIFTTNSSITRNIFYDGYNSWGRYNYEYSFYEYFYSNGFITNYYSTIEEYGAAHTIKFKGSTATDTFAFNSNGLSHSDSFNYWMVTYNFSPSMYFLQIPTNSVSNTNRYLMSNNQYFRPINGPSSNGFNKSQYNSNSIRSYNKTIPVPAAKSYTFNSVNQIYPRSELRSTSIITDVRPTTDLTYRGTDYYRNTNEYFGSTLTQDDKQIFVGSIGSIYDKFGRTSTGSVFVFDKDSLNYDTLTGPTTSFGYSLNLAGDQLIVGCNSQSYERISIFRKTTSWNIYKVIGYGTSGISGNQFWSVGSVGASTTPVIIDENTYISGIPLANKNGSTSKTGIVVSCNFNTSWTNTALDINGLTNARTANDLYGTSVALDSNFAIIGAPGHTTDSQGYNPGGSGSIFTYYFDNSTKSWNDETILRPSGVSNFGYMVDVKFNTIIGSTQPYSVSNNTSYLGKYSRTNDEWSLVNTPSSCQSSRLNSLSIKDANTIIEGVLAIYINSSSYTGFGGFYHVPTTSTSSWTAVGPYTSNAYTIPLISNGRLEQGKVDYTIVNSWVRNSNNYFGSSVDIKKDGSLIAINSPNRHTNNDANAASYYGFISTYYKNGDSYSYQTSVNTNTNIDLERTIVFSQDNIFGSKNNTSYNMSKITVSSTVIDGSASSVNVNYGGTLSIPTAMVENNGILYLGNKVALNSSYGSTRTYDTIKNVWSAEFKQPGSLYTRNSGDNFGWSVHNRGDLFIVGAPYSHTDKMGNLVLVQTGAAYCYENIGNLVPRNKLFAQVLNIYYFTGSAVFTDGTNYFTSGNYYDIIGDKKGNSNQNQNSNLVQSRPVGSSIAALDSTNYISNNETINNAVSLNGSVSMFPSLISSNGMEYTTGGLTYNSYFGSKVSIDDNMITVSSNESSSFNNTTHTGMIHIYDTTNFGYEYTIVNDFYKNTSSIPTSLDSHNGKIVIGYSSMNTNGGMTTVIKRISDGIYGYELSYSQPVDGSYYGASVAINDTYMASGLTGISSLTNTIDITGSGGYQIYKYDDSWKAFESKRGENAPKNQPKAIVPLAGYRPGNNWEFSGMGGGGSGYQGGSASSVSYYNSNGGRGGSNLVPQGGTYQIGVFDTPPKSDDSILGNSSKGGLPSLDTSNPTGGDGGHALISINDAGQETIFHYTGEDQQYVVKSSQITIKMWGAGGGAGYLINTPMAHYCRGGAGAYVDGTLSTVPGETLTIIVGRGGKGGQYSYVAPTFIEQPYGGGGIGGSNSRTSFAGNGGGRAEIMRSQTSLAIAGGGGGGAAQSITSSNNLSSNGQPGGSISSGGALTSTTVQIDGFVNSRFANDLFGASVEVIDKNNILIGSPKHSYDQYGNVNPTNTGAVFKYTKDSKWSYKGKITPQNPISNTYYGSQITSGNQILIGNGSFNTSMYRYQQPAYDMGASPGPVQPQYVGNKTQDMTSTYIEIFDINLNYQSTIQDSIISSGIASINDMTVSGNYLANSISNKPVVNKSGAMTTYQNGKMIDQQVEPGLSFGRQAGDQFGYNVYAGPNWVAASSPYHSYSQDAMEVINSRGATFIFSKNINSGLMEYEDKLFNDNSSTNFNCQGLLSFSNGYLTTGCSNKNGTFTSTWLRKNNKFDNLVSNTYNNISTAIITTNGLDLVMGNSNGVDQNNLITGNWVADQTYVVPGLSQGRNSGDMFGYSVAINHENNYLAISSLRQSYNADGSKSPYIGAIYVFNKQNKYVYEDKITNSGTETVYMAEVKTSGNSIIAGPESGNRGPMGLYHRVKVGSWSTENYISDPTLYSIAIMDSSLFAYGTPTSYQDTSVAPLNNSGSIKTFRKTDTWNTIPVTYVEGLIKSRQANDKFGIMVASSNNYVLVGAPNHSYDKNGITLNGKGSVWIYSKEGHNLNVVDMVSPSLDIKPASFGSVISIAKDNSYFAVGCQDIKTVFVYQFDGQVSTLVASLTYPSGYSGSNFGCSVSIQRNYLAIGDSSMVSSGNITGGVFVFENMSGIWTFKETVDVFNNSGIYNSENIKDFSPVPTTLETGALMGASVAINDVGGLLYGSPGTTTDSLGENPLSGAGAAWIKYLNS